MLRKINKGLFNWNIIATNRKRKSSINLLSEDCNNLPSLGEITSIEIYQARSYEDNSILGKIIFETSKGYLLIVDRILGDKFVYISWTKQREIIRNGIDDDFYEKIDTIIALDRT